MKSLVVLSVLCMYFGNVVSEEFNCGTIGEGFCKANQGKKDVCDQVTDCCNATFGAYKHTEAELQKLTNEYIIRSYDYLFLGSNFGAYAKSRPGFAKVFHGLSDKAWENAQDLIKFMSKRGGSHNFKHFSEPSPPMTYRVNEVEGIAKALDIEKQFATKTHAIHRFISHANNHSKYDPQVAHYLDEHFHEYQVETIRTLSGHVNDLHKFANLEDNTLLALSLQQFDEYLQK